MLTVTKLKPKLKLACLIELGLSNYCDSIHYRDSLRLSMNKIRSRLPDYLNSNFIQDFIKNVTKIS